MGKQFGGSPQVSQVLDAALIIIKDLILGSKQNKNPGRPHGRLARRDQSGRIENLSGEKGTHEKKTN